jgi:signal transduction histidine kinase
MPSDVALSGDVRASRYKINSGMSLKTRWLTSMLGVVLVGTALTTLISSRISFYGAERAGYEWLAASHRRTIAFFHGQLFLRLEAQAELLVRVPGLAQTLSAHDLSGLQVQLEDHWRRPDGGFWALLGEDGKVLATSQPSCVEKLPARPFATNPARGVLMCGRAPALVTRTEVRTAQGLQGWLILGVQLNDAYTGAYFDSAGPETVLIDREGPLASSFQDSSGGRIFPELGELPPDALWAEGEYFGKHEIGVPHYRGYFGTTRPMAVGSSTFDGYLLSTPLFANMPELPVRLLLIVPVETVDIGAFYSTVIMIVSALVLLLILGTFVWRRVTGFVEPISVLGRMTARVAQGDLKCEVPVTGQDELGQLTRDFNDMVRKLRETQRHLMDTEKMAVVGQLAAGVGHEINNPLTYVTANLGFAVETLSELSAAPSTEGNADSPAPPLRMAERIAEVTEALREALDGARRVGNIVQDLRTFARRDYDEARQVLDVREVLETALKLASSHLRLRARVTRDFRDIPPVQANEARLVQVFLNLLVNAAQAMPEGREEGNEVSITTALDMDGRVLVEVRDTGVGMRPEVLERIFEPFFTTKPIGVGTGLGLPICRNIVETHGGSISVHSELDKGSTFRITLPSVGEAAPTPPRVPTPSSAVS